MKHTKFEWMPLYSYLDRTAITAHLSDMAAQGWMLEKIGGWNWRYRRTEPKKLRFKWQTSAPIVPGLVKPHCAFMLAPSMYS